MVEWKIALIPNRLKTVHVREKMHNRAIFHPPLC